MRKEGTSKRMDCDVCGRKNEFPDNWYSRIAIVSGDENAIFFSMSICPSCREEFSVSLVHNFAIKEANERSMEKMKKLPRR